MKLIIRFILKQDPETTVARRIQQTLPIDLEAMDIIILESSHNKHNNQ